MYFPCCIWNVLYCHWQTVTIRNIYWLCVTVAVGEKDSSWEVEWPVQSQEYLICSFSKKEPMTTLSLNQHCDSNIIHCTEFLLTFEDGDCCSMDQEQVLQWQWVLDEGMVG